MNELERRDDPSDRVAKTVRHALELVGPADSSTTERVVDEDQLVS